MEERCTEQVVEQRAGVSRHWAEALQRRVRLRYGGNGRGPLQDVLEVRQAEGRHHDDQRREEQDMEHRQPEAAAAAG